ncbi:hypothetical protein ACNKFW_16700 (plasmid) [Paracoccus sp. TD-10]|uniref:hypothetical protein n=1 Tax=Paracoccus sp. TD-10 TaxID=3395918 RepID=UPI003AAE020D
MRVTFEQLVQEVNTAPPKRKLRRLLERTDLPADIKAILFELSDLTVQIGGKVLAIGRKLLDFALNLLRAFPAMALGVIVAYVMAALIASLPGGPITRRLAALLTPLLLVLGIGHGVLVDMGSPDFRQRVDRLLDSFGALVGVKS